MPRPKRSKVASAVNPTPRAGPAPKASKSTPARRAVAEDIEDEIEDDGENYTSMRRVSRPNSRRKAVGIGATSPAMTTDAGTRKGKEPAEDVQDLPEPEASTPSIEASRREAMTPANVELASTRRGRQPVSNHVVRRKVGPEDVISSIESDIGVGPITLPRKENTTLGQPAFRGRRAPSIFGRGVGAARVRSSSMGLEMRTAGDYSAPGTAQSTRFGMLKGRRRERQPSILGSNRKKMLMQQEAEQGAGEDDEDEDEILEDFNDFDPDDESTPLNAQKANSVSASNHSSIAIPISTSSNSRKRRQISKVGVSTIQVPHSSPPLRSSPRVPAEVLPPVRPGQDEAQTALCQSSSPSSAEEDIYGVSSPFRQSQRESPNARGQSPLPSNTDICAASPVRTRPVEAQTVDELQSRLAVSETARTGSEEVPAAPSTPELFSEIHAPPRSTSPVAPTFNRTNNPRQSLSRRRHILATQDSPASSPPSLTHSPNYKVTKPLRKKEAAKKAKAEAPLTTALLQNLLPQRRRRRKRRDRGVFEMTSDEEEEIDVSGLQSEDDELSYVNAPTRRGKKQTQGIGKGRAKTSAKTAAKLPVRKGQQNSKVVATSSGVKGIKRTYGSLATGANKENLSDYEEGGVNGEGDYSLPASANAVPEDSAELEEKIVKEMKRLKRKFEVVDEWEMEFEDVQGNSSDDRRMLDAR